jgi:outer membrane protein assembly factor BamE
MRKLLIFIAALATLAVAGCSTYDKIPEMLDKAPLVYHPTIQQGNVIEQEQINQLEPGMTKRQVKFLLGTAVLTDFFHLNR